MTGASRAHRKRGGVSTTIFQTDDGGARLRYEFVDDVKDLSPPLEPDLAPMCQLLQSGAAVAGRDRNEKRQPLRV
ncbi:hypothetical protein [Nonomuraea sp. KM90]|uniref:hypothetical protein n=1 Tax=Nonomuraea sp. KM90 TaxID=3457428 RepID=UPI003FCD9E77